MCLGGLGVLGAKPIHEPHKALNFLLLVFVGGQALGFAGFPLDEVLFVVAGVAGDTATFQFDDVPHELVEKLPVMRNQQDRSGIVLKIILQPNQRVQVQVVRWLVKHQQVRFLYKQPGQMGAHDPATAQFLGQPIEVGVLEAKPTQNLPRLGDEPTATRRFKHLVVRVCRVSTMCLAKCAQAPGCLNERRRE